MSKTAFTLRVTEPGKEPRIAHVTFKDTKDLKDFCDVAMPNKTIITILESKRMPEGVSA